MTFEESDLEFTFNNKWAVKKYDDHLYYDALKSAGLKAIDFLAIFNNQELVLVEVKNYKVRFPDVPLEPLLDRLQHPESLADIVQKKVDDTIKGIEAIQGYLDRKWLFRVSRPIIHYLSPRRHPLSWSFWSRAHSLLHQKLRIVLWMEMDEEYPGMQNGAVQQFRESVSASLATRFPEAFKVQVVSHQNNPFSRDIEAKIVPFSPPR